MSELNRFCGVCGEIVPNSKINGEPIFKKHCDEFTILFTYSRNPKFNNNGEFMGFPFDSENNELYKIHHGRMVEQFFGLFDNGYTLMMFEDLENDVKDFLRYIPLEYYPREKRKEIYSPKLSNLLTIIVARIDEFFRSWEEVQKRFPNKNKKDLKLGDYLVIFNDFLLDSKELMILSTGEFIKPLERRDGTLSWYTDRNLVTHDGYNQRDKGNLDNVIIALGALFILNCEHKDVWRQLVRRNYIKVLNEDYITYPYVTSTLFNYKSSTIRMRYIKSETIC